MFPRNTQFAHSKKTHIRFADSIKTHIYVVNKKLRMCTICRLRTTFCFRSSVYKDDGSP